MSNKDITQLVRQARREGWKVSFTKNCHLKWEHPLTKMVIISSSTPSCCFAVKKIRKDLDRALEMM